MQSADIGIPVTSSVTDTLNKLVLMYRGVGDGETLSLKIFKNEVLEDTLTFVIPYENGNPDANLKKFQFDISIGVVPGDVLTLKLYHPTGFNTFVETIGVCLGVGQDWYADVALPAGTYQFCLPI